MRKIGIVTEYFYPHLGGVTEHVYFFSRELIRRGFSVTIITGYEGEPLGVELPPELRLIRLGKSKTIYTEHAFGKVTMGWRVGEKVREVLEKEKFDLLHVHSPVTPTLPLLSLKYTNTVTIGTVHSYFDSLGALFFYGVFRRTIQRFLDKMDGLIAVSPPCISSLERFFRTEHTIIPNGVALDWFSHPSPDVEKLRQGRPTVLYLGRLDPRNGLDTLLEAFRGVAREIPEARLVIVGDGPMRPFYEKQAGPLRGKNIFFEGQVNGTRPDYFASADVFCYPASKASFGITLLESMAAGCPVVAIDNVGFRHVVQNEVNGLLVPQADSPALSSALVRVLKDKEISRQLVENGRRTVEEYSWSRVTDRVLEFYNQIYLKKRGEPFAA